MVACAYILTPFINPSLLFYSSTLQLFALPFFPRFWNRSKMGVGSSSQNSSAVVSIKSQEDQGSAPDLKPKKKICCACPETKKLRDECIVEHGEPACEKWIEAHRKCLRAEGFNV